MEEMKTTIIADLEKYAHELPEKPAVCDKKRQLTYQELNMLFHIWQFNIWEL